MLSSTWELVARFDETNEENSKHYNPHPEICPKRADRESSSSTEEVNPHNLMVGTAEEPHLGPAVGKMPFAGDLPLLEDEFQNRSDFKF